MWAIFAIHNSSWSRISREVGTPTPEGSVPTYYFEKFLPKTAWKWKNLDWTESRSLAHPWIRHCIRLSSSCTPARQFWLERFLKDIYKSEGKLGYFQTIRESFCKRLATGSVEAHFLLFKLSPASGLVITASNILISDSSWLISRHKIASRSVVIHRHFLLQLPFIKVPTGSGESGT